MITLKELRNMNGYTLEQVADYLDIDINEFQKVEEGQQVLNVSQMVELSNLYGYDIINKPASKPIVSKYDVSCATKEDLKAISKVKSIALNLRAMESI